MVLTIKEISKGDKCMDMANISGWILGIGTLGTIRIIYGMESAGIITMQRSMMSGNGLEEDSNLKLLRVLSREKKMKNLWEAATCLN